MAIKMLRDLQPRQAAQQHTFRLLTEEERAEPRQGQQADQDSPRVTGAPPLPPAAASEPTGVPADNPTSQPERQAPPVRAAHFAFRN